MLQIAALVGELGRDAHGFGVAVAKEPRRRRTNPDSLLDLATALQLQEQRKALSPGHRAAFCRTFRAAFQGPDSTPSVAGLIRQQRQRIWI